MIFNVLAVRKDPSIIEFSIKQQGSAPERKPIATITKIIRNVKLSMLGTTYDYPQAYCRKVNFTFPYPVEPQDSTIYGYNLVRNGDGGGLIGGCYRATAIVKKSLLNRKKFEFDVFTVNGREYLIFKVGPGGRPYYYVIKDAKTKNTVFMIEYINSNLDSRMARILVEDITLIDDVFLMFAQVVIIPIPVDEIARVMDPPRETYVSGEEELAYFDKDFLERNGKE